MEDLAAFFAGIKTAVAPFVPGVAGSAIAALTAPKTAKRLERAVGFLSGCAVSIWLTVPVLHFFKLDPSVYFEGVCFGLGYAGLSFASKVVSKTLEKLQ